ncbi:MAG TPA: hypothetical protein VM734_10340 [Kofleriaceae bacterium]|nr:hypothetical protein [Kofleriaceae bacterium]
MSRAARPKQRQPKDKQRKSGGGSSWDFPDLGGLDGEGVLILIGVVIALALGWAVVELLAPALLVCTYALVVGALRRVANDRHACEGRLARSIAWGAVWATIYTAPLAAVVAALRWL